MSEDTQDKTKEVQKAFSEVAAEFAAEAGKAAEENPESLKVENLADEQQMEFNSKFFRMYNIYFKNLIKGLNKKGAARVIERLIAYPLETEAKLHWASKNEENAFLIGNQLLEVKYLMYKYVLTEQMAKAKMEQDMKNKEGMFKETTVEEKENGENKES